MVEGGKEGHKDEKNTDVFYERPLVKRVCQRKSPFKYINTSKQSPNMFILTRNNTYIRFWNINATQKLFYDTKFFMRAFGS